MTKGPPAREARRSSPPGAEAAREPEDQDSTLLNATATPARRPAKARTAAAEAPRPPLDRRRHDAMANALRALAMDAVEAAKSGHPGLPMGAADIAVTLFDRHLRFDPTAPDWPDRDRFVLSAGHGSMLLYGLLHLAGYPSMTIEEIRRFRQLGSLTPGHPEHGHTPGVETTTGPLGQGLANAVGMALAERMNAARFGAKLVDHRTYVLASDGDLMEGIAQEAMALAGHLRLNRLIVLFDDNGISIDGPLSLSDSVDQLKRAEACGWRAERVDGHDPDAIDAAIERAKASDAPTLIACRTTIGFGAPTKAGKSASHGSPLGADEIKGARAALGWGHGPFEVPDAVRRFWSEAAGRGAAAHAEWRARLDATGAGRRREFERAIRNDVSGLAAAVRTLKKAAAADATPVATRKASETVLEALAPVLPNLVSGSADLTGSNNTKTAAMGVVAPGEFKGRFIHWGIREHAMASAMNGMALHGGCVPASGTFLVFSDYMRPALRLAALMGVRAVHVLTHDSIGVGEDGPTHQPVEHLAALRAIPNLDVFRPADLTETAEAWEAALSNEGGPSVLALTRQNLTPLKRPFTAKNLAALGAYELAPALDGERARVSLFASGSEVSLALDARDLLAKRGIAARVVSVPCLDRFLRQPESYRRRVIGRARFRVGIEAAIRQGWDAVIGSDGVFVGMEGFGASGPIKELFAHFGLTPERVADDAERALKPARAGTRRRRPVKARLRRPSPNGARDAI